ncbi:MAG: serine hydroxymethyltransferase, partial [Deltaproteobacteria bacterium]|nr:serine hydroxymethyltransferase [Deltaproteobacteria bacterium]
AHFEALAGFIHDVIVHGRTVSKDVAAFRKQFVDMQYCFTKTEFEDEIQKLHQLLR